MKNKIKNKFVPLEPPHSTRHLDISQAQPAPDMYQLKPSTVTVSLRMPLSMLNTLKLQPNKQDIPYQSYMKMLIARALHM